MTPKNRHLHTIAQLCWAVSSQLRNVSTIRKNLLNNNMSPTCLHNMANVGPLRAEIGSGVWGLHLGFVTAAISLNGNQPKFARCLAVCWAGEGATYFPRVAITLGIDPHFSCGYIVRYAADGICSSKHSMR